MGAIGIGELAAMGAALCWTLAALSWTAAGRYVGSLPIGFIRLAIATVFLASYSRITRGLWLPTDAAPETWLLLGASGLIGFFFSDVCLFRALVLIGPRLTLLVQSLVPPTSAVLAWAVIGERLSPWDLAGMVLTLSGVLWVVLERTPTVTTSERRSNPWWGLGLAAMAAGSQAVGFLLVRLGLNGYDPAAGTYIRVLAGIVGYVLLITMARRWPTVRRALEHRQAMAIAVFGAMVGPFLGVTLALLALSHIYVGIATTIISTTPVLVLPFVIVLYRERVSPRAALGALLSVAGVAILVLIEGAPTP